MLTFDTVVFCDILLGGAGVSIFLGGRFGGSILRPLVSGSKQQVRCLVDPSAALYSDVPKKTRRLWPARLFPSSLASDVEPAILSDSTQGRARRRLLLCVPQLLLFRPTHFILF